MKKNRSLLLLILAFALLLGGAYVLYGKLSQSVAPDQLSVQTGPKETTVRETPPQPEESTAQETDGPRPEESAARETPPPQAEESAAQETDDPQTGDNEPEKIPAPDFTVYDIDGNEACLSDYLGKPVILNWWASWCGPCQSEMPDFDDAYGELGENIQFLMINVTGGRETVESAAAFIEEQGYTFPVLYDTEGSASIAYSVYSLPTSFFIDADGNVIAQATGAISRDILQKGIDLIWTE